MRCCALIIADAGVIFDLCVDLLKGKRVNIQCIARETSFGDCRSPSVAIVSLNVSVLLHILYNIHP